MIGERIKIARNKAGLSLRQLSEAMQGKVSPQAIGKYERGEMLPSSGVLLALSKALGVSLTYLMDTQGIELGEVDFRSKSNTTVKERARVKTEVLEWVERYLQIEQILDMGSAEWEIPIDIPCKISNIEEAEKIADEVRSQWGLGYDPIPNMTELLEEKGMKVFTINLPEKVSGFTCSIKRSNNHSNVPVVVVNNLFSLERRRLTLGHELAHQLIDSENLSKKDEEKAANFFAGAFLMPREHLDREVGKHRNFLGYQELINLKRLYGVSGAALLVRLKDIGIISDATITYSFQSIARTWRMTEPEELETISERGTKEQAWRFERLCYRALAEDLISLSKATELLRQPIHQVEAGLKGPSGAYSGYC
ncbi:transcriptional regulator [Scytonema hofmannii PCC 7110]|uniref:Transcriptional regulator n=1 Tax=Scytonema hofmannii PCC 7110 TaxID=128403 RepID=A0A139XH08_9CYAN|nr:XRE family transcriptional regulator [Scytonema hofmannii]KYC43985.1 transcriptional regulator [Scytonema hofmannii PCC 7110]